MKKVIAVLFLGYNIFGSSFQARQEIKSSELNQKFNEYDQRVYFLVKDVRDQSNEPLVPNPKLYPSSPANPSTPTEVTNSDIVYTDIVADTHGGYDPITGFYTFQVAGNYLCKSNTYLDSRTGVVSDQGRYFGTILSDADIIHGQRGQVVQNRIGAGANLPKETILKVEVGDVVRARVWQSTNANGITLGGVNDSFGCYRIGSH